MEDVEYGDQLRRAGDKAFLFLGAANRDPSQFPDPDRLVLDRPNARTHYSFGGGAHVCLGAPLARLNFATGMRHLFDRLPGLTLGAPVEWQDTLINWGPSEVHLQWDPA
jgi:cytochrome P450